MSESHDELRERLETEYRARIVRKLRAEADRIEAGGSPICYATSIEDESLKSETALDIDAAMSAPDCELGSCDETWSEFVEYQEWGVHVSIEEVRPMAHRADLTGSWDYIVRYGLVDPDDAPEPEVLEQECPRCGHEVRVPPGGSCPVCESREEVGDE